MGAILEIRTEESKRDHAIRLMECVITSGAVAYAALDALYVELKIGGGFFVAGRCPPRLKP
jgi:hypothetical protein